MRRFGMTAYVGTPASESAGTLVSTATTIFRHRPVRGCRWSANVLPNTQSLRSPKFQLAWLAEATNGVLEASATTPGPYQLRHPRPMRFQFLTQKLPQLIRRRAVFLYGFIPFRSALVSVQGLLGGPTITVQPECKLEGLVQCLWLTLSNF